MQNESQNEPQNWRSLAIFEDFQYKLVSVARTQWKW